jgi:glyoxylase-like metal-dependent hydrolase (beta-lactamase superfamily II)
MSACSSVRSCTWDLGCASYLIADAGVAAVVDPKWEIEEYLALADEHDFEIRHVLETHDQADHVSGHGRLAAATGATIHGAGAGGLAFPTTCRSGRGSARAWLRAAEPRRRAARMARGLPMEPAPARVA